ncbi:MAG: nitroreductase family protein [Chloroflexi bacterium]|nr:nitroreductase family protein [Chloroflexota bacterium]
MEVYEALKARRTVRRFKPDPVSDMALERILEAARWAPSSRNQQPWHLVVIKDRERLKAVGEIARTGGFIADAPLAIAIVMSDADQPGMDAGRALQQMEVMAWSEGMGTCFVTLPNDENRRVKEILDIPVEMDLVTVLPFGYRTDDFKGRGTPRKPLAEMVHLESFGRHPTG